MADELKGKHIVGRMRVEHVIYLALMDELMEERYGDQFIVMCNSVQEEVVLLCGNVPLDTAIECVSKKFADPEYSIKKGLIAAMKLPDPGLMS